MPMLRQLQAVGFDCLFGVEPALGVQDLGVIAREMGPRTCHWTGLSSPTHLGRGTPEEVRAAVREFYATCGRQGTILTATPSIRPQWPWENVQAMLDEWRKVR
jgi:hypothetical protein